jgi:branched-chain amino acid transport system permease protein
VVHQQHASGSVSVSNLSGVRLAHRHAAREVPALPGCFLVVFAMLAKNLVRSHIGREWMAIRDMDVAAAVIGIRPMYAKLTAFAVSSFIVGVAGALWGFVHLGSWEPAAFSIDRSFQLLFMIIIGGLGSIMGSFFGAAFIVILPIFLNQFLPGWAPGRREHQHRRCVSHTELMIFGALIVFFLIVEPHGLAACGPSPRKSCGCGLSRTDSRRTAGAFEMADGPLDCSTDECAFLCTTSGGRHEIRHRLAAAALPAPAPR